MDKLPQRDDLIYKEIEEIEDYELTNCIAYEMAIRNKEAARKLSILKRIETLKYKIIEKIRARTNNYYSSYKKYPIIFKDIIEEVLISRLKKEFGINYNYSEIEENPVGFKVVQYTQLYSEAMMSELISLDKRFRHKTKANFITKQGYIIEQIYNRKREIKSEISSNFKRKLTLKNELNIKIDLPLNIPKEELIAYISKIKDDFDKDNSIIKTPLELLGETLEKSYNKKTPKKPKAFVYADWFYIYDYWKYEKIQGKTDKDIFVALEVENNVPYKEDMIRKIRDKMKYFIDDLGYKELITGVKNS